MSNKDNLDALKSEISGRRIEVGKLKIQKTKGMTKETKELKNFKIIGLTIVLAVIIGASIFAFHILRTNVISSNNTNSFLTPNQLSLLLLGDPVYSYYNGNGP